MIFTFYSYKGGVGRSMALATVAHFFAARGLKVLAVDFDLEAPGLELYFFSPSRSGEPRAHLGLIDLIRSYRQALTDEAAFEQADFKHLDRFTLVARKEVGTRRGSIHLMTAGQREPAEKESDYSLEVRSFDWQDFFYNWKGDRFFDWLRRQWTQPETGYDVILVDSRTGLTEMGGVCAYQLADAAVLLCAANYQNLKGTKSVAEDFLSPAVLGLRNGRPLQLVAIPARLQDDHPRLDEFFQEFEREIDSSLGLPAKLAAEKITYRKLALPYLPEFSISEDQVVDYKDLGKPTYRAFERLADALTLLAENDDPLARQRSDAIARWRGDATFGFTPLKADTSQFSSGYDAFIDYGEADKESVAELARQCGSGFRFFMDLATIPTGGSWPAEIAHALNYSASLLVCFGVSSASTLREELLKRARESGRVQIIPVLLPDGEEVALRSFGLDALQYVDFRKGINGEPMIALIEALKRPAARRPDTSAPTTDARNPYPGGRAYTEDDSSFFFGREQETGAVLDALRENYVVLLEGPANVGKTSLVAAALLPQLRALSREKSGWTVNRIAMVDATVATLKFPDWADPHEDIGHEASASCDVIIIDGLDTFSGTATHETWSARFQQVSDRVAHAGSNLRVLLVWRGVLPDDEYKNALEHWQHLRFKHIWLKPIKDEALRLAIEQPARVAAHLLENGLVERLIESAGTAKSTIFQIQLVLAELWKDRRRGWLTNPSLDALGHLGGVFRRHLDLALENQDPSDRSAALVLFRSLSQLSVRQELVSKPLPWSQAATLPAVARVGAVRLRDLLASAGLIDLWRDEEQGPDAGAARMSLARSDPQPYLEGEGAGLPAEFLKWRSQLDNQIQYWQTENRSIDSLLLGKSLSEAEGWLSRLGDELTRDERSFIEASVARGWRLRGFREPFPAESGLKSKLVTVKAEFRTGRARAVQQSETISVHSDDVVEVEFADGPRLWLRGDDYHQQFASAPSRGVTGEEVQQVPESLDVLPRGMRSRGPVKWAVKSLKVLSVDLGQKTAVQIGKLVDGRTSPQRPGLGLYRCSMNTGQFSLTALEPIKLSSNQPVLIFIHGTTSSTWGSFGGLWSAARSQELEALRLIYGDRVLAFEHGTLSKSPIENASELADLVARLLPSGAKLHLVSHSRGGLVGELLCRANVVESIRTAKKSGHTKPDATHPFSPAELQLFQNEGTSTTTLRDLGKLQLTLQKKRFQVDRFVRVACPTLGTTLASGRLDRWFSMIGSVATATPDTPLFDTFKDLGDFAAAVIKERTDPSALPGLKAMMPDSALIKLVNWPSTIFSGELTVIAGDIDPDAWWAKLLVFGTDRFYEGDHDLVVNTASMYGGVRRDPAALLSFHKGPGVNHFTYFSNSESAKQLVRALTRDAEDQTGFELLEKPTVDIARAAVSRSAEPRPVVFVLPGIMGSELSVERNAVWAKISDLVFGGLGKLRIDAKNVKPTQPIARYYGELIEFLAQTHKVVPFAYDWRLPVEQEADRLAQELRREFEQATGGNSTIPFWQKQPVRVLAHSMGGLVARTMIARNSALWREVCAQPGARLLMLGTPNGGSHWITELLLGSSSTMRKLALVDLRHSQKELLEIISRFPGVLAMLPLDAHEDYFAPQTWKSYQERAGTGWILPRDQDLAQARRFRQLLDRTPLDPASTIYVAGQADVTLAGMSFNPEARHAEQIQFMATARGDGRVTWDSGIPTGVPTWYMDVGHGDMPAHSPSYSAFLQLLQNGTTNLLSQTAPVSPAAAELFVAPRAIDDIYPNAEDLEASALGAGRRGRKAAKPREAPVRIRVVHAYLAMARHPVAVGHYAGDSIISAEAHLDRALDGELTRRHQVGLYPGPVGTSALFTNPRLYQDPPPSPLGAIVIGLGTPGALNAGTLSRAFSRAMLDYVIEWSNQERSRAGSKGEEASNDIGLTTLLVGTGAGGVTVPDSVHATLQSVVRTNQALAAGRQPQRIREVEFMELWEDRAIQAVRACQDIESNPELRDAFALHPELDARKGGLRRASYEDPSGWWRRVQILGGFGDDSTHSTLRFKVAARGGNNEVGLLITQRGLIDRFVEEAIRTTHDNRSVSRTLFEMLWPNQLKEQTPDQDDIVLLLDEEAARYPWELLEDPGGTGRNPFVIEHGVLRQLETLQFRESVRPVVERNALVIGDPVSPFVELKGAQAEAEAVSRSLEANGRFHVDALKRPDGDEVIQALCAMPYRVLHLAGHGVYKYLPAWAVEAAEAGQEIAEPGQPQGNQSLRPITGMVIGDGIYLTPAEIRQMRQVPELVFINCCHLGHIEASDHGTLNERRDQNLIAAYVAAEFIRMGVHAVVAAGWAIDDGAALTFATVFYDRMLEGTPFGQAVKEARVTTFDLHPETNTWGAYQCYGDPDYRLVRKSEAVRVTQKEISFVSRQEALIEIANLAARLSTKAGEAQQGELEWLAAIRKALERNKWLEKNSRNGKICAALAQVYSEAQLFREAIDYFRMAMVLDPSAVTLRDMEQLANLLGRQALASQQEASQNANETGHDKARKTRLAAAEADIDEAISLLKWLMDTPSWRGNGREKKRGALTYEAPGKTAERLALLGSAYKRKAWISNNPGPALEQMKQAYEKACNLAEREKNSTLYPRLNQLFSEVMLSWDSKRKRHRTKPELRRELEHLNSELAQHSHARDSFWDEVMLYDGQLALVLLGGSLKGATMQALADCYRDARRRASRREFATVLDQIEFLSNMALKLGKKDIANSLDQLGKALQPPERA